MVSGIEEYEPNVRHVAPNGVINIISESESNEIDGHTCDSCPFCGSANGFEAILRFMVIGGVDHGQVSCRRCFAMGPAAPGDLAEAVAAWNSRVTP